jgi:hypothetical protein
MEIETFSQALSLSEAEVENLKDLVIQSRDKDEVVTVSDALLFLGHNVKVEDFGVTPTLSTYERKLLLGAYYIGLMNGEELTLSSFFTEPERMFSTLASLSLSQAQARANSDEDPTEAEDLTED